MIGDGKPMYLVLDLGEETEKFFRGFESDLLRRFAEQEKELSKALARGISG